MQWLAVGVNEREIISKNDDLDTLKFRVKSVSGAVVFIPDLNESPMTFGKFASLVESANDIISEVNLPNGRTAEDVMNVKVPGCFRVVYSNGTVTYECWQGTGAGGRWDTCPIP
jgi:hypothetical protein